MHYITLGGGSFFWGWKLVTCQEEGYLWPLSPCLMICCDSSRCARTLSGKYLRSWTMKYQCSLRIGANVAWLLLHGSGAIPGCSGLLEPGISRWLGRNLLDQVEVSSWWSHKEDRYWSNRATPVRPNLELGLDSLSLCWAGGGSGPGHWLGRSSLGV